jgi:hypothetical protein
MYLHGSATLRARPELDAFHWLSILVRHIEFKFLVGDMPAFGALNMHFDYDRNPGIQASTHGVSSTPAWPLSYGLVDAPERARSRRFGPKQCKENPGPMNRQLAGKLLARYFRLDKLSLAFGRSLPC